MNVCIYLFYWLNLYEFIFDLFDNICNRFFFGKGVCKVYIIYWEVVNINII